MKRQTEASIAKSLKSLSAITDTLWRKSLENKAWIIALYGPLVDSLERQTKNTKQQIKDHLKKRQKEAYQKLLEQVEAKSPQIAAELDNRGIDDVL